MFKIKNDGTYKGRLVALGYNQIPGVDFTDTYAAEVNDDATIWIVLGMYIDMNWSAEQIDVETTFLYGDLEEEII